MSVHSTKIYKRDTQGRIRIWWFEVDGSRWRSHSGLLGGTVTPSGWTHCEPKSQPTAEEQAAFEAEAEMTKKLDRLYRRSVEELDGADMMFAPMLAQKWKGWPKGVSTVYIQPKLDGIRCVATADGLFSRQGKKITGLPHIEEALEVFFCHFPDVVLDGELYNHEYRDDFEKIVSAVRKQNSVSPDAEKIQFHIYDMFDPDFETDTFSRRIARVERMFGEDQYPGIVSVTTIAHNNPGALENSNIGFLAMGYEGTMVRLDEPYEIGKRSKSLLKLKQFDDSEFEIVRVLQGDGNWHGYAKKLEFRMPDGRTCGAQVKGNQEFTKQLLAEAHLWIGRKVTIQHFGWTADGMPRFPIAIKFWAEDKV